MSSSKRSSKCSGAGEEPHRGTGEWVQGGRGCAAHGQGCVRGKAWWCRVAGARLHE